MQCSVEKNSLYNDLIQSKQTNKKKTETKKESKNMECLLRLSIAHCAFPRRIKMFILRWFVSSF